MDSMEPLQEVVEVVETTSTVEESPVEKVLIDPVCLVAVHAAARGKCLDVQEIAEEIGAKTETVERCLGALAELGLFVEGPGGRYCHCKAVEEMSKRLHSLGHAGPR